MLFAYFGPETALPVTSALAAITGFSLMFGHMALLFAGRSLRRIGRLLRPERRASAIPAPHAGVVRAIGESTVGAVEPGP